VPSSRSDSTSVRRSSRRAALAAVIATLVAGCFVSIDESRIGSREKESTSDDGGRSARQDARAPSPSDGSTQDGEPPCETCGGECVDLSRDRNNCGSCGNVCSEGRDCRGGQCVAPSSCKELLALRPTAPTGVHTLSIGGTELPAYCDMTTAGGGFTLVFRISAGQKGDPYALYTGAPLNDDVAEEATLRQTTRHYVSRLLSRWNVDMPVEEARARVLDAQGNVIKEIVFDAKDTSAGSFFAKGRVKSSPWTDLDTAHFFSAVGDANEARRFYIHRPYNTCETDEGWLVVHGTDRGVCAYEQPSTVIRIYYAKGTTAQRWVDEAPEASAFAVLVR